MPFVYGHVIVDEAQDLSAMELRMIGRRATDGSMTVLGDLAQATAPGAPGSWEDTVGHPLAAGRSPGDEELVQLTELTIEYRVPSAILEVANRLLAEAAPTVTPVRSVRPGADR